MKETKTPQDIEQYQVLFREECCPAIRYSFKQTHFSLGKT